MHLPKLDNETIFLAFAVITGLAMLLQTLMLLAITVALRKTASSIQEETEKLRTAVLPVVDETRDLIASSQVILTSAQEFVASAQGVLTRVTPKVEEAVADLAVVTQGLRKQTAVIQSSTQEIIDRVHVQTDRVDSMFSTLLDTVDRAGGFVAEAVSTHVRQISGMLRSVKAIIESLGGPLIRR